MVEPRSKFRLYWATQPPPAQITDEHLARLMPVEFSTEQDAIHAAALLLRARQHVWCIESPEGRMLEAAGIAQKCGPLLALFQSARGPRSKE